MKFKLIFFFSITPFILFAQIFDDIKKEDDRKDVDHLSKGFTIGVQGTFTYTGGLKPLIYTQTYLTSPFRVYNRKTLGNNVTGGLYEAFFIYRYKKLGLGLGINQLNFTDEYDTFIDGAPPIVINNDISITSLIAKFYFRERISNRFGLECIVNLGVPVQASSSLSNNVSSAFQYGGEFNYKIGITKNLDIKFGLSYTRFDLTYNTFDYYRPDGPGASNGSEVSYDFTMNKGVTNYFGIMGVQLGLQYNINKRIN